MTEKRLATVSCAFCQADHEVVETRGVQAVLAGEESESRLFLCLRCDAVLASFLRARGDLVARFNLGSKVCIDGDPSIRAIVTGIAFYTRGVMYECGWMHSGGHQSHWIDERRLSEAE